MRLGHDRKNRFLIILLTVMMLLILGGCGKKNASADVSFVEDTITIEKLEDYTLKLRGVKEQKIKWVSQDKKIATVKDGVVYAKSKGTTTITATIDGTEISCNVIVNDNYYIPTIELGEPEEGVNMVKNGTYTLYPTLAYNGNTYTDATFSYSVDGKNLEVDENGCIHANGLGEGTVSVKATWRDVEALASLDVRVVDVSTSIEVADNYYNLYVNGEGQEWPAKADLGIVVFDKDNWVQNPGSKVTYTEIKQDGDTEGAAVAANGSVYAKKEGTTHLVAQYKSKANATVKSALVTVKVEKSPADIYMTPIEGKDFEFFFEALGTENSVKWEDKTESFHLINKTNALSDERAFIINREYLQNIMKYTKAESISFEYCTDGISTGLKTDDQTIYQGFYPNWYDAENIQRLSLSKKWTKVEYRFDSFPKDEDGLTKTLFLMNTVEGMYIRNVKLYLPGEDRTNYDPNHNYLEKIEGEEYEFFIEALSDKNSVKWNSKTESYQLTNTVADATDERAFIFNRDYMTNVMKHTKAESISFEYRTYGKNTGFKTDDQTIYQGFYPEWYDVEHMQRFTLSTKWSKAEIYFDDFTKDENGEYKTIFLMNTIAGMELRNIQFHLPGEDRTNYDKDHDYMEEIKGTKYEFFIEPLSDKNSVKWDKLTQSYHLTNKVSEPTDERAFIFNRDYMTNIIKHTNAESIAFEFKTDGKSTGFKTDDQTVYQGFYPDWYDPDYMTMYSVSDKWQKVEIYFKDIPKDANGDYKTVFLMNTVEGMHIRNFKLYKKGEDRTNYDKTHNYLEKIEGKNYEFFIEALGSDNSVKWDKGQKAYHLTNKVAEATDERAFIMNQDYLTNVIKNTKATSISFEIKFDGKFSGFVTDDQSIYQGFWPNWADGKNVQKIGVVANWTKMEINFSDIPRDSKGNPKTIFLMNTVGGMYIRNITFNVPGQSQDDENDNHNYLEKIQGKNYEFFIEALGIENSVKWEDEQKAYHLTNKVSDATDARGFVMNQEYLEKVIKKTNATSISFEVKFDGKYSGFETDDASIYQGFWPDWADGKTVQKIGVVAKWTKMEINFADIPKDAKGNLKTIFLMNTVGGMYIRNITINVPGQSTGDADDNHNYLEEIQGKNYEFFVEPLGSNNSVAWDTAKKAFHLVNKAAEQTDERGFTLSIDYISKMMQKTDAIGITFEVMSDLESLDFQTDDLAIYSGFYPDWYQPSQMQRFNADSNWHKVEINFSDIPKDDKGNLKSPFVMGTVTGLYIRNITIQRPVVYEIVDTLNLSEDNLTWIAGDATELYGGNNAGIISYTENGFTLTDAYAYSVQKMLLGQPAGTYTDDMKLRLWVKATPNMTDVAKLELHFFNSAQTGNIGAGIEKAIAKVPVQGACTSIDIDIAPFLNDAKKLEGLSFATFGYRDWTSGQMYTIEVDRIEVLAKK